MNHRPIKFRAWDKVTNRISYLKSRDFAWLGESALNTPERYAVMQFTGLIDKNGKEIYEGDVVRCASKKKCAHEVVWLQEVPSSTILGGGMPGFYLKGLNEGYAFLGYEEVIGNIYENPELLK